MAPLDGPATTLHKLVSIPPFHWLLSDILGQLPYPMQTCLGRLSAFVVEEPLSKSWRFIKIRVLTKNPAILQQGLRPFLTLRLHCTHSLSSHSLVRTPHLNISLVMYFLGYMYPPFPMRDTLTCQILDLGRGRGIITSWRTCPLLSIPRPEVRRRAPPHHSTRTACT